MGLVYLFALVVGLGILVVQVAMGAKGDATDGGVGGHIEGGQPGGHIGAHAGPDGHGDADGHGHGDADGHDAVDHGSTGLGKHLGDDAEAGAVALFFSTRFWIFTSLAFGMSGSLIHVFALAGTLATLAIASLAGIGSGLFAVFTFRAIKRTSSNTSAHASEAVGQIGRVLVACGRKKKGQIRVELRGHSVDLLATTDEEAIARGELILVEDLRGNVAHVSRRPPELE